MNREIKFRAWDGDKIVYEEKGSFPTDNGGTVTLRDILYYTTPREYQVMQYTGLKDKNGKEIYESDHVELEGDTQGSIIWVNNNCCWGILFKGGHTVMLGDYYNDVSDVNDGIEVIGNIYEEKKKEKES